MPTVLDDALITDTLKSLPGWEGGPDGIWRDVHLTAEQDVELRRQVAVDGESMGHQPLVESVDGGTRFTLSTPESGGVTELDIAFASHLSDLAHTLAGTEPGVDAVRAGKPVVVFRAADAAGEDSGDEAPTIGVASVSGGTSPMTPLPADSAHAPEPGVSTEQSQP